MFHNNNFLMSSSLIRLAGLDDHIAPSQACVKPVMVQKTSAQVEGLEIQGDGTYVEIHKDGSRVALKPAKISLSDCLACSGCITSAESILVSAQSTSQFLAGVKATNEKGGLVVISISPQSWASVAAHFALSGKETLGRLATLFRKLGVQYVLDINYSRDIALLESAAEFKRKFRKNEIMVASACPGWVCYAEKTQHSALPFISSTKSPQQISGHFVKNYFAAGLGFKKTEVYHCTMMPCFDKKLEASRMDFADPQDGCKDVDVVLTSVELLELLHETQIDFNALSPSPLDAPLQGLPIEDVLHGPQHEPSGGFAAYIFKDAAKELFGVDVGTVNFEPAGRHKTNTDFAEATLDANGTIVLRVAICYGFKNIQNIVRQIKSHKCPYHFIEVMACPAGCVNGGAQLRAEEAADPRHRLQQVQSIFNVEQQPRLPEHNPIVAKIYSEYFDGRVASEKALRELHTSYHAVEENINPIAAQCTTSRYISNRCLHIMTPPFFSG